MGNYFGSILSIFSASQTILISPSPFFKAGRHCLVAFTTELFQPFLAIIMVDIMVLVLLSSYGYQFHHKNANSTNIYIWVHFIEGAKGQYFVPDERSPSKVYLYFVNVIILNNLF